MKNNVLIVDDVSLNRKLIRGILSKAVEDICFFEAEDGYKALEIIKKESIGVVILDIMMPGISGLEMIPKIREIDKNWCISIIMCSAIHEMHSIETALSLGAIDYFTKPLTEEQMKITLPLKVRNALEHYQNKLELTKFNDHIKRELDLAGQIQKSLVSEYTEGSKALMWGRYIPCEDIGGDVSFFRQDGDKCWMMMADITGHGISAAMLSTMINVVFGIYLHTIDSPAVLLSKINEMLIDIFGNSNFFLVSAFVGCLSEDSLIYVNAGHPAPLHIERASGNIAPLEPGGMLLGIFENAKYDIHEMKMENEDVLMIYTDGLYEKVGSQNCSNDKDITDICQHNLGLLFENKKAFLDRLLEECADEENGAFDDDVAVMLVMKK